MKKTSSLLRKITAIAILAIVIVGSVWATIAILNSDWPLWVKYFLLRR